MKKFLVFVAIATVGRVAFADVHVAKEYVQCNVKTDLYADNQRPGIEVKLPILINEDSVVSRRGDMKPVTVDIYKGYQVQLEGFITKPGNWWVKGDSMILMTASLFKSEKVKLEDGEKSQLLFEDSQMSGRIWNPAQLKAVQEGSVYTTQTIMNPEYFALKNSGETPRDFVVSIHVGCKLVR